MTQRISDVMLFFPHIKSHVAVWGLRCLELIGSFYPSFWTIIYSQSFPTRRIFWLVRHFSYL